MYRKTPAEAHASMDFMAPLRSTVSVREGSPPPAPADQITTSGETILIVMANSETEESSMDWTMGVAPRDWREDNWVGERMME